MMEWKNPIQFIWMLCFFVAGGGLFMWSVVRNRQLRRRLMSAAMAERLFPRARTSIPIVVFALQMLGAALCFIALARPQYGQTTETVFQRGSDLYVLLDVSRSMLAKDVVPSRLERAKSDIAMLTNRLQGERIGLIAFAGQAVIQSPLTVDYENFRRTVASIDTMSAPRGGTAIGDAIRKAMEVFAKDNARNRAILLITDGGDQESNPTAAAQLAAENQVAIYAIGLGDASQGARVPSTGNYEDFVQFEGEQVWSKLDDALLKKITQLSNGVYIPAGTKSFDLNSLYSRIIAAEKPNQGETETKQVQAEQFQWPLGIGILLFAASCVFRKFDRPTHHGENSVARKMAIGAAAGLVVSVACFPTSGSYAAELPRDIDEGIRHFDAGNFADASKAFSNVVSTADKSSEAYKIALFNLACSHHRSGDDRAAIDLYQQVSIIAPGSIASFAQANLGNLYVEQAEKKVSENQGLPSTALQKEIQSLIAQAIDAYESARDLAGGDDERPRRSLEIVKLWSGQLEGIWEADEIEKALEPLKGLNLVDSARDKQRELFQTSLGLDRTRHLEACVATSKQELRLSKEWSLASQKLIAELSSQSKPAQQDSVKTRFDAVQNLCNSIEMEMKSAAMHFSRFAPMSATLAQKRSLLSLQQLWTGLSPFEASLLRAYEVQSQLSDRANEQQREDTTSVWQLDQEMNAMIAASLQAKAKDKLDSLPAEEVSSVAPNEERETQPEDISQLSPRDRWLRAVELAPQAASAMERALQEANEGNLQKSKESSMEAQRILEKLLELIPPQESENPSNDSSQDQKDDKSSNSDQKDGKSSNSDQKSSKGENGQPNEEESKSDSESKDESRKEPQEPSSDSQKSPSTDKSDKPDAQNGGRGQDSDQGESGGDPEDEAGEEMKTPPESDNKEKQADALRSGEKGKPEENEGKAAEDPKDKNEDSESSLSKQKEGLSPPEKTGKGMSKSDQESKTVVISASRLEDLLRQVREREAEKKQRDKQWRERLYRRAPVEKDW